MEYPSFAFTGIYGLLLVVPRSNADYYRDYGVFCDLYGDLDSSIKGRERERKPEDTALWGSSSLRGAVSASIPDDSVLAALFCMCAGGYGGKRGSGLRAPGGKVNGSRYGRLQ